MPKAAWGAFVDWEDDADFSGTGEDVTLRVRHQPGIVTERGRDAARQLSPPMAGAASCDLDNRSRDYSLENTGSPLYDDLYPGHLVRYTATDPTTAIDRNIWTGRLFDLPQHPERERQSVSLPALGPLASLRGVKISTQLYTNILTSVAVGHVLDAAGWPAGASYRTIDTGKTTLLFWWCDEVDAFDMLAMLTNTEGPGANLYEDGSGRIVWESRHYRLLTARCTASQSIFGDGAVEPKHAPPLAYEPRLRDVVNRVSVAVNRRTLGSLAAIWQLGETLTLGPNEVRAFGVTSSDPFTAAVCQVTTDYVVSLGSLSSVALNRTSGVRAILTLTAGGAGATVTGLQVRAQVYAKTETAIASTVDTAASVAKYGAKSYPLRVWAEIAPNVAQDFVNAIAASYQEPRPAVRVRVNNGHAARLTQQLEREISDRITVQEAATGLNTDMFIEYIKHEVAHGGLFHTTLFGCEKAVDFGYSTWDTAVWDLAAWGY